MSTAPTTSQGDLSAKPAMVTAIIGSSAHFASRTMRRFSQTAVRRSASGEQRMYGRTSMPATMLVKSDFMRSSPIQSITVRQASVFRKLSFSVPKKFVAYNGRNELFIFAPF